MALFDAITEIQDVVLSHHQTLVLTKEPNNDDLEIDLLITNRYCTKLQGDISKRTSIPVLYYNRKRGFGYFIEDGVIRALDLVDFPILSEESLAWLVKDAQPSLFNGEIPKLSRQNQVIFYVYKSIKKWKIKDHRYSFIMRECKGLNFDMLIVKIREFCSIQQEDIQVLNQCELMINELYQEKLTFDLYSLIIRTNRKAPTRMSLVALRFKSTLDLLSQMLNSKRNKLPIVAVIGVDGSGKSSVVQGLKSQDSMFKSSQFRFETKEHIALFKWLFEAIPKASYLLGVVFPEKLKHAIRRIEHSVTVKMTLYETRFKLGVYVRRSNRGELVVVDRWWFDYFAASKRSDLIKIYPNLINEYLKLKKPDLIVFMDAADEVIESRRPNDNLQELKIKRRRLLELVMSDKNLNVIKVNGMANIEDNMKYINSAIYDCWRR